MNWQCKQCGHQWQDDVLTGGKPPPCPRCANVREVATHRCVSNVGDFRVRVLVEGKVPPDLGKLEDVANAAATSVMAELVASTQAQSPSCRQAAADSRRQLVQLFDGPVYVTAIPNGYSDSPYTRHLPWFRIVTGVGAFVVGWRKRVIHLEWTETACVKEALDLFPTEEVTRYDKVIHAWSLEKARDYVTRIVAACVPDHDSRTSTVPPTYLSTQSTTCAGCGQVKHTPLRNDAMGGYVCLTCIDKELARLQSVVIL